MRKYFLAFLWGGTQCYPGFLVPIVFLFTLTAFGQQKKINDNKDRLLSVPAHYDRDVFQAIFKDKISKEYKIVALGEFSHGAYEPIAFKANLAKYLIEAKGYRNILFEQSDFSILRAIRNCLDTNRGNDSQTIEELIENNQFPRAISVVYLDLFRWIKQYNLKNPNDPVSIAGFELDVNENLIEYILNRYVIPWDYKKSQEFLLKLSYQPTYMDKLKTISSWYDNTKSALEQNIAKKELVHLDFLIKNALMSAEYAVKSNEDSFNNPQGRALFRDSVMAENIVRLSYDRKAIVWSHNGHVLRTKSNHMGSQLNKIYGDDLYVIATDFAENAAIDFVDQDRSNGNKIEYSTKVVFSESSTAANRLYKVFNIREGIFGLDEIVEKGVGQNTNAIGVSGTHYIIPEDSGSFDLLVVFKNSYPVPEE